jgi:NAD(P)-dependent dehydrogenase (short-subunit alcohol dehydrogenase family)
MMKAATPSRVCLIVGLGSGGIGDHLAKRFAAGGYKTVLMARSEATLNKLASEIPNSRALVCDVTDPDQVKAAMSTIETDYKTIDAIMYNAGSGSFKPFDETSVQEFETSFRTGPLGLFTLVKHARPLLSQGSAIGVTGATASWRGMPVTPAFAAAKFATRGLTQSLSRDLGPKGVHVYHVVIDGIVRRPDSAAAMPNKPPEEFLDPEAIAETFWTLAQQPPGCWTQEIHVGAAAAFGSIISI